MNAQTTRDPWRIVWQIVTGNGLLIGLFLAAATGLMAAAWLPQAPAADPAAYAKWLSETQARFGQTTQAMQSLGLFSITHSLGFRALLALLASVLLLHLVDGIEHALSPAERRSWSDLFPLFAKGGLLLFLLGQLMAHLWGWQVDGLLLKRDERVSIPGTEAWIATGQDIAHVTHSPGTVAFVNDHVPGVRVSATDETGQSLGLQRAAEAEPLSQVTLVLDGEQYVAIPEAQLVVQLVQQAGQPVETTGAMRARIYRSPPGRLESEATIEGDSTLAVDGVSLNFAREPHIWATVTSNPGRWPAALGGLLATAGVVGGVVYRSRAALCEREEAQCPSPSP